MKVTIDFQNGMLKEMEVASTDEAKAKAVTMMRCTQKDVIIRDRFGDGVSIARWHSGEPSEEEDVMLAIGDGYYTGWELMFHASGV